MSTSEKLTLLTAEIAVTGFLTPKMLSIVKTLGFRSVINLMPPAKSVLADTGEKELAYNIRKVGLEYREFAVSVPQAYDETFVTDLQNVLAEVPKPAVIFSRTGRRAVALWAIAAQSSLDDSSIRNAALRAGHDISDVLATYTPPAARAA